MSLQATCRELATIGTAIGDFGKVYEGTYRSYSLAKQAFNRSSPPHASNN
jgi:hypothetical protein